MRGQVSFLVGMILLYGLVAPTPGEEMKYYEWTDEEGITHIEDTPPRDYDYETHVIEFDPNAAPSPGTASRGSSSPTGTGSAPESSSSGAAGGAPPVNDTDRAIAEEEQKRLEEVPGTRSGAETASGAQTAPSSSGAPSSGAASGAGKSSGAATAPGAALPPVFGP